MKEEKTKEEEKSTKKEKKGSPAWLGLTWTK
jgi:hypothetical protein